MLDINNIDWTQFRLAKVGRGVKLLYNKDPVRLCTSSLYTPFGVKSVEKEWTSFSEHSIDCSLNQANTESSISFRTFVDLLDACVTNLVKENLDIFAAKTVENTELQYISLLRENKNYPKLMKLQLPRDKNGNFESFVFDEKNEKIKINESNISEILTKGKIFKCIIECSKIWVYNGKVGSIWKIDQLKLLNQSTPRESTNPSDANIYTQLMIS